jgi:uroporphyrinogen-III synthase
VLFLAAALLADSADVSPDLWSKSGLVILAALSVGAVKILFTRETRHSDYLKQRLEAEQAEVRRLNAEIQRAERAEKAEAEVRRLNDLMQSSTLPAVVKATEVMGQLLAKDGRRGHT